LGRRKNKGRNVSGVLLLDKPQGGSSNHALQKVKRLFGAAKAGHTGSLDPLATGMLPVCFGEATKISAFLLDADKRYHLKCQLGVSTTTGDTEGEIVDTQDVSAITQQAVEDVLPTFLGEIEQVPPMYSALKHKKLDSCAHITALRRLSVGPYDGEMMTMDKLMALAEQGHEALDSSLQPVDSGVANWPDVHLAADAAFYVQQGQPVMVPHAPTQGWVRIYDQSQFLGLGEIQDDGMVAPRRMIKQCA